MEKSNFALRLLPSLHKAAQRIADRENCSVNQLINVALAEKLAVLDADYWEERKKAAREAGRSDVLRRLAGNETPKEGDEIPEGICVRKRPSASGKKTLTARR